MNDVIGIIDRGVGGLGLYKKIRQNSNRPILYFADNCNQPYGLIEASELKNRLDDIIKILKEHGATKIILACNSASVVYPDTNTIKGVIQFGVTSLIQGNIHKKLGLIATQGTVKSGVYTKHFNDLNISVIEQIAQPFAIHVENGTIEGKALEIDAQLIMDPLKECDAILLACTHFPAITSLLQDFVKKDCQLIDPMDNMLLWIEENWPNNHKQQNEYTKFLVTGSSEKFINSAKVSFTVDINSKSVLNINLPL